MIRGNRDIFNMLTSSEASTNEHNGHQRIPIITLLSLSSGWGIRCGAVRVSRTWRTFAVFSFWRSLFRGFLILLLSICSSWARCYEVVLAFTIVTPLRLGTKLTFCSNVVRKFSAIIASEINHVLQKPYSNEYSLIY